MKMTLNENNRQCLPVLNKGVFVCQISQIWPGRSENVLEVCVLELVTRKVHHGGDKEENHSVDVDENENVRDKLAEFYDCSIYRDSILETEENFN